MPPSLQRRGAAGALALAACLGAPPALLAQKPIPETVRMREPHSLRLGDKVRAWSAPGRPYLEGTVVGVGADSLTVTTDKEAVLLTLPELHRLQVRQTDSHIRRAAAIGAGVGLLASFVLVTDELFNRDLDAGERIGWTAAVVAGGAAAGAGVGYRTREVNWHPVDLVTLKPSPTPVRPSLRLSWTVRF